MKYKSMTKGVPSLILHNEADDPDMIALHIPETWEARLEASELVQKGEILIAYEKKLREIVEIN